LVTFLNRLKIEHDEWEVERVMNSALSADGFIEFRRGVREGFEAEAIMRRIIRCGLGAFEDMTAVTVAGAPDMPFGLKRLTSKAAILSDGLRGYHATGVQFGSGVGRGETHSLLGDILEAIPNRQTCSPSESALSVITAIRRLAERGTPANVILVINSFNVLEQWRRNNALIPDRTNRYAELHGYEGVFGSDKLPIIHLYASGFKETIAVLNLRQFGSLIQHPPKIEGEFCQARIDHLCASLTDLNASVDRRNAIRRQNAENFALDENPDRYLRRAVLVEVFERFRFRVSANEAAFRLLVNDPAT
jgi:hypothetical protein